MSLNGWSRLKPSKRVVLILPKSTDAERERIRKLVAFIEEMRTKLFTALSIPKKFLDRGADDD